MPRHRRLAFIRSSAAVATVLLGATSFAPAAGAGTPPNRPAADTLATETPATATPPPAQATTYPRAQKSSRTFAIAGRGWGHGRGMSQWGSQGYATTSGWSSNQILGHYYGGTTAGTVASAVGTSIDTNAVRIRLIAQDARPTTIAAAGGTLAFACNGAPDCLATLRAGDDPPAPIAAVRLTRVTEADADGDPATPATAVPEQLLVEVADTCSGPFRVLGTDGLSGQQSITVSKASGAEQLSLCRADGVTVWYPGTLTALIDDGVQRTVNTTSIDEQLRSVVPAESPASWSYPALESQSVAARSYALAGDTRHVPYADTCDTILCQVYKGHAIDTGSGKTSTTHPRTDQAIQTTAGVVRLNSSNRIARTEFSSTSGGWTAGGTFPAVKDDGDAISPLHTWNRSYDIGPLEERYGNGELLVEIEVLERNGLGADGGRVTKTRLHFLDGSTADVSGNTVRSRIGMLSDWFTPPPRDTAIDPEGVCPAQSPYIEAVYDLFLGRQASAEELNRWCATVGAGGRLSLTDGLAKSDEWAGVQIADLYTKILGRPSDDKGRLYWLDLVVRRGLRIEDIAAEFYGSNEYYGRAGGTDRRFIERLYTDLLGRTANTSGTDFWLGKMRSGLSRSKVAAEFYASLESRADRVDALFLTILERGADPSGRRYWIDQLLRLGDVALAANLAASSEYYDRSFRS